MKRDTFEVMIEAVLSDMVKGQAKPSAKRSRGIGGIRYGPAERDVAGVVRELAQAHNRANAIVAPSPEFVPPCF